jgi:hypothetical protein
MNQSASGLLQMQYSASGHLPYNVPVIVAPAAKTCNLFNFQLAHLFGDHKAVVIVADNNWDTGRSNTFCTHDCILQHRELIYQRQKLLWI